ncbi:MAG: NADH-quinone oxidoreductase subunit L [bacterium]|nr:NADH-quinone oxidoreductase subunit L [bacterium]
MINQLLAVPLAPFLAFAIISLFTLRYKRLSTFISILGIAISLILSLNIAINLIISPSSEEYFMNWIKIGAVQIPLEIIIDPLSAMMLVVVSLVSLCIQIYSIGYMHGDTGLARYYGFISLFSFSMLTLVLSNNFAQMYMAWELVGLCSYLLIGFWYHKPSAAAAGKKAFLVTRLGDVGFLIGILLIFKLTGTLSFSEVAHAISQKEVTCPAITIIAILIFCGAIGKSAQFPLHVWLPDAMEGPTPISALIHAATMVAAGVYLTARLFFIFLPSIEALAIVAYIGGFTALFAATIALAQNDIKKIVAYSTISQLGFMMLALGSGGYTPACFHLMTHAFFKALLFLCAGSVIHSLHSNNIWDGGGLLRKMPITAICFIMGGLSLAGLPPFAGFFSKDEIVLTVFASGNTLLFFMATLTIFLTAFYTFRLFFVVFTGEEKKDTHVHESPLVMTLPMILLAILSLISGWCGPQFSHLIHTEDALHPEGEPLVMVLSVSMALAGIFSAWVVYAKKEVSSEKLCQQFAPINSLLTNKYWIDELYGSTVVRLVQFVSLVSKWIDIYLVDGLVNGTGRLTAFFGSALRLVQTGYLQNYIFLMIAGLVILLLIF